MKTNLPSSVGFVAALLFSAVNVRASSTQISVNSFSCNKFDASGASIAVSDGGDVMVTGPIGFPSGLSDGNVVFTIKKGYFFNWFKYGNYQVEADLCDGATSSDGSTTCPAQGYYSYDSKVLFTIPESANSVISSMGGGTVYLYINENGNSYGQCLMDVALASAFHSSYAALGLVALVAAGGVYFQRRRTVSVNDDGSSQTNFEMMSDARRLGAQLV